MQPTNDLAPKTRVRIVQGTHKGKRGVIGETKGTGRNAGKVEVAEVGHRNESYWVHPNWVEVEESSRTTGESKTQEVQDSIDDNQIEIAEPGELPASNPWKSPAEFTVTLKSGLTVEVRFVPGMEGELQMHQFDLRGSVSPTGFQSHFVLAVESEQGWVTPADYALTYAELVIAQFEEEQRKASSKQLRSYQGVNTATLPASNKDDSSSSTVEAETSISLTLESKTHQDNNESTLRKLTPVAVVEELTDLEIADRQRLELKVERAFYEAGCGLRELRDRRLYRDTHPNDFIGYCRDRFDKTKQAVNYLIAATEVYENLATTNSCPDDDQRTTNGCRVLPTNERQVRDLAQLSPDEQRQVWNKAVEQAGGKVPSGQIVKGIVERLKEQHATPPVISYQVGDVVEIRAGSNPTLRKHNGCWGIVTHVGSFSVNVHISVRGVDVRCKPDEMDKVDERYTADIRAVSDRVRALLQRGDLGHMITAALEALGQQTCFSNDDLWFLSKIEERYGGNNS